MFLLPIVVYLLLWYRLLAYQPAGSQAPVRLAGLQAAVVWGAWLALTSEALSLLHALSPVLTAAAWVIPAVILAASLRHRGQSGQSIALLRHAWQNSRAGMGWAEQVVLAGLGLSLAALLAVALASAPNNNDSLFYHMSRVVHWIQNRSLDAYATAYGHQLYNPIWAEEAVLHLRILAGSDRLVNLVQWGSLLGCLVGASTIARLLGAGRAGQIGAVVFTGTIPIAILEATSTQNDLVTAFWLVCLACFTVLGLQRRLTAWENAYLGLAFGLGLLTKGTFYAYSLPFMLAYAASFIRRTSLSHAAVRLGMVLVLAMALNLGYWSRNLITFGTPLGAAEYVSGHAGLKASPGAWLGEAVKFTAGNFYTPWRPVNSKLWTGVYYILRLIGQEPGSFHLNRVWNHEDTAGAPLHVLAGLAAAIAILPGWRRSPDRLPRVYSGLILAALACLVLVVSLDNYSLRFWVPALACAAPAAGLALEWVAPRRWLLLCGFFLLYALPWVLFNQTRPLVGMQPQPAPLSIPCSALLGCTRVGSVLVEPSMVVLFANHLEQRDAAVSMGAVVRSSACREVGLRIDSSDPEYLYWRVLQSPQSGIRVETLYPAPGLEFLVDRAFKPCAVICTICTPERMRLYGLEYIGSYGDTRLYQGAGFTPESGG